MYERISGIGIDLVSISQFAELDKKSKGALTERTFSAMEKAEAEKAPDKYSYLAGRFAVKEAVFKAAAHLTPEKTFDFRIVETKKNPDGSPEIVITEELSGILHSAGITKLLVSITNQGDFALAQVTAVSETDVPGTSVSYSLTISVPDATDKSALQRKEPVCPNPDPRKAPGPAWDEDVVRA